MPVIGVIGGGQLARMMIPAAVALGSSMHKALEWLHKARKNGRGPALADFLKVFEADWTGQKVGVKLKWNEDEPEDKLLLKAKELLGQYYCLPRSRSGTPRCISRCRS